MKIKFTKMHGCGNDYVYIDCMEKLLENPARLSTILSDRRKSIGGDGIILIEPSDCAEAKMRIFNKDGSEGKMCGNGIRCVAKYLFDKGLCKDPKSIKIETLSGVKTLEITENNGNEANVKVNMGKPSFKPSEIPVVANKEKLVSEPITIDGNKYEITCVSVGNPHCVIFLDEVYSANVREIGSQLSANTMFPEGVNVEFASVVDKNNITMRVWERGSGETLACGSGACATVIAAVENGFCEKGTDVTVHLRGGKLKVNYGEEVFLIGNATKVFEGEIEI